MVIYIIFCYFNNGTQNSGHLIMRHNNKKYCVSRAAQQMVEGLGHIKTV